MAASANSAVGAAAIAVALAALAPAPACGAPPSGDAVDAALVPIDAGAVDDVVPIVDAAAPDAAGGDAGACAGLPDGTPCDDGDKCTQVDRCAGGACAGGQPIVCEVQGECRALGTCNPATGLCNSPPLPDDTACDDRSICTLTDACAGGECVGRDVVEFPGDPCDDGICFGDVTVASGIDWTSTPELTTLIGGGGALSDFTGDGWLDVLVGAEGGAPRLYRNDADGSFTDVTVTAGLPSFPSPEQFMGFAAADYDNDGDTDLYLLARGGNVLLANDGAGVFTDVTAAAGVEDARWSTAAAFGDYDGDGWLDLYIGNYIDEKDFPLHTPFPNALFHNAGDGTFTDVTAATGTAGAGTTLAVTWTDYDGDGDVDLMVCNDFGAFVEPNRLYDNDGGALSEVSGGDGAALELFCMGIAPGDYDRDGDLDYYFTNLGRNTLLQNAGGAFTDVTAAAGVELTNDACFTELFAVSWAAGWHDFDNDGWLDLYVSNGHIPAAASIENPETIINVLYKSDGASLTFTDISRTAGIADEGIGRGAAFGDYDADGDIDVLQVNVDGVRLFRNDSPSPGNWIHLDPRGRVSNRDGAGARVRFEVGADVLVREVNANTGYLSSSERAVHAGIAAAEAADRIAITWPSGIAQQLIQVPAAQRVTAVEPFVTIDSAAVLTDPVIAGADADVELTLRNHTGVPVGAASALRVIWPGGAADGVAGTAVVGAGGTATVTVTVSVPPEAAGTAAVLVPSATDAGGGLDQRALPVAVAP